MPKRTLCVRSDQEGRTDASVSRVGSLAKSFQLSRKNSVGMQIFRCTRVSCASSTVYFEESEDSSADRVGNQLGQ